MTIYVQPIGLLIKYLGTNRHAFELENNATLSVLFLQVDHHWGNILPEYLWNRKKVRFRTPVIILCNGSSLEDPSFPLTDGMELQIGAFLSGG